MDKVIKLDIQNMIADYENERITGHDLIDYLKEITAWFGSPRWGSYIHHVIRNKDYENNNAKDDWEVERNT